LQTHTEAKEALELQREEKQAAAADTRHEKGAARGGQRGTSDDYASIDVCFWPRSSSR